MFNQTRLFLRRKLFSPRRKPKQQEQQTTHRIANKRGGPARRGMVSTSGGGGSPRHKLILRYALYGAAAGTLFFVANAFLPENRRFFKSGGRIQAREDKEKPRTTTKQAAAVTPQHDGDPHLANPDSITNTTNSEISQQEWKHMLDTTMAIPGIQVNEIENQRVIVAGDTVYVFTTEAHPAHPAVVTRMVYKKGNAIYLGTVGHYSGSRREFEAWWKHFLELNDQFINDAKKSMGSVNRAQDQKSPTDMYSKFGKDQREDVRQAEKEKQKNEYKRTGKQGERDTPVHTNVKDESAPSKTPTNVQHAPNAKQPLHTKEVPQHHQSGGLSEETKQKIQAAQDLLVKQKLALEMPVSTIRLDESEPPRKGKAEREALEQKLTEETPVHINVNDEKPPSKTPYDKEHASNAKQPLSTKEVIDPRPPPGAELTPEGKARVVAAAKARGIPTPELTKPKKWEIVEHFPHGDRDLHDMGYVNEKGVSVFTTIQKDQELK